MPSQSSLELLERQDKIRMPYPAAVYAPGGSQSHTRNFRPLQALLGADTVDDRIGSTVVMKARLAYPPAFRPFWRY